MRLKRWQPLLCANVQKTSSNRLLTVVMCIVALLTLARLLSGMLLCQHVQTSTTNFVFIILYEPI